MQLKVVLTDLSVQIDVIVFTQLQYKLLFLIIVDLCV